MSQESKALREMFTSSYALVNNWKNIVWLLQDVIEESDYNNRLSYPQHTTDL